jgi:hypothetical protein
MHVNLMKTEAALMLTTPYDSQENHQRKKMFSPKALWRMRAGKREEGFCAARKETKTVFHENKMKTMNVFASSASCRGGWGKLREN